MLVAAEQRFRGGGGFGGKRSLLGGVVVPLGLRDIFALGLAARLFLGARNVGRDLDLDLGMQTHADLMETEVLDRFVEENLHALNGEAAGGDGVGNVARRD